MTGWWYLVLHGSKLGTSKMFNKPRSEVSVPDSEDVVEDNVLAYIPIKSEIDVEPYSKLGTANPDAHRISCIVSPS